MRSAEASLSEIDVLRLRERRAGGTAESVDQLLAGPGGAVVLGGPGSGKTTLTKRLARSLARPLSVVQLRLLWSSRREDLLVVWFVANQRDILRTVGVLAGVAALVGLAVWNPGLEQLQKANLSRAALSGAHLFKALLTGTDLRGAKYLTLEQIAEALGDETTKLPEGLSRPIAWTKASDEDPDV